MPSPTSLLVATALVAIPSTAGIYHLATSSTSSKTVEQEDPTQELDSARDPAIEEEHSEQALPETPSLTTTQNKALSQENADVVELVKHKLSDLENHFPYGQIEEIKGARTNQFDIFVFTNDSIRESLEPLMKKFVNKKEHENKDIKDLVENVLGFSLIDEGEESTWSRLVQIRKDEAGTQTDMDSNGVSRLGFTPKGSNVIKDDIVGFCLNPSEANSHLGMYSEKRKEQEETKEYRLFTYYSYCTKGSHYLNDKLKFDPISE